MQLYMPSSRHVRSATRCNTLQHAATQNMCDATHERRFDCGCICCRHVMCAQHNTLQQIMCVGKGEGEGEGEGEREKEREKERERERKRERERDREKDRQRDWERE